MFGSKENGLQSLEGPNFFPLLQIGLSFAILQASQIIPLKIDKLHSPGKSLLKLELNLIKTSRKFINDCNLQNLDSNYSQC